MYALPEARIIVDLLPSTRNETRLSVDSNQADNDSSPVVRQVCANGVCMQTNEVEAKLDEGNIDEAESALREGLSLNSEVQTLPLLF